MKSQQEDGESRDRSGVYSPVRLESEMFGERVIFLQRPTTAPLADSTISWHSRVGRCVDASMCTPARVQVQANKLAHVREIIHASLLYECNVGKDSQWKN